MAEYSRLAKGSFTAGASQTSAIITLPFAPDYVEVWNLTNIGTAATAGNITRAWWDNNIPPYTPSGKSASQTMIEVYANYAVATSPAVSVNYPIFDTIYTNGVTGGTVPAGGISVFSAGLSQQFGTAFSISGITKATQAVVSTTAANGYSVGDTVILQGIALGTTNNMQLLNNVPFTIVTINSSTDFVINWNTNQSTYTAISGSPAASMVKKVLYPFLYLPQDNVISAMTLGTTTTISTTMYHNLEIGQEVAFRVPGFWGTTQLNSLPNTIIPGSPIYGYVVSLTDNWNFVVNINSTTYKAFSVNNVLATSSSLLGLTYAQVVPVGDVNTGGKSIGVYNNTTLYPSPAFPLPNGQVPTINGPAIKGAFVNNTSQGFIIGNGTPQQQGGTGTIVTASSIILWHAYLHDYANP